MLPTTIFALASLLPLIATPLLLLLMVLAAVHVQQRRSVAYRVALRLPGEPMLPIVGNMMNLLLSNSQQSFQYIRDCAHAYGGCSYRFWILGTLHYNAVRAQDVEQLLASSQHIRKSQVYDFLHPLMGTGLLTSRGAKWSRRRRILTPAFHFHILQDFLAIFCEESAKLVDGLKKRAPQVEATVLQDIIPRFALNTICESAMGVKIDSMAAPDAYRANLITVGKWLVFRCTTPFMHNPAIYRATGLPFIVNRYLKQVHAFSEAVIRRRRQAFQRTAGRIDNSDDDNVYSGRQKHRYAMLDTLFAAEAADSTQIDEHGIREEVDTFMFEGYDTTSSALTFCLLMLAHHQPEQQLVLDEIRDVCEASAGGCIDGLRVHDYGAMAYFDCFVRETLRLYPPVAFMGRELTTGLTIGDGVELPVGTQVHIHAFDLHRDAEQFPQPERFDPERFRPEQRAGRHPYAYLAFSAGPRNCIGQRFAMLEIKSLLAHILLQFRVMPVTRVEDVVFASDIILRSSDPIKVQFVAR